MTTTDTDAATDVDMSGFENTREETVPENDMTNPACLQNF
jgi:hypothetical protein